MKKLGRIIFGLLVLISCEQQNEMSLDVPQDVIDKSLDLFDGAIIEKVSETEDGLEMWEVKIENENGSIVKFYWSKVSEVLIKIEGISAPFNYNINPGNNLINSSVALTVAKSAVKNEDITKWKLAQNENFIDKWVYSIEFDEISITVIVDALNGDVLETD